MLGLKGSQKSEFTPFITNLEHIYNLEDKIWFKIWLLSRHVVLDRIVALLDLY